MPFASKAGGGTIMRGERERASYNPGQAGVVQPFRVEMCRAKVLGISRFGQDRRSL